MHDESAAEKTPKRSLVELKVWRCRRKIKEENFAKKKKNTKVEMREAEKDGEVEDGRRKESFICFSQPL